MQLVPFILRAFQAALIAFPFIMGFCFGYAGAFFALLILAALTGVVLELHFGKGPLSPYRLHTKHPHAYLVFNDPKFFAFFGILGGAPIVLSIMGGAGIFAFRCVAWLITGTWLHIALQTLPLEFWFVIIFPLIWVGVLSGAGALTRKLIRDGPEAA
jgi:hypothetical protein